mmetsp:Transcript_19243/g.24802  ORF Transcript_19243/g.24802 Transcript_19243/m.24802 type:complete len:483 (+) Transcript_19243:66-1514(+)
MKSSFCSGLILVFAINLFNSQQQVLAEARHSTIHSDYVQLHRAQRVPDLFALKDVCVSLYSALPQMWIKRDEIKDELRSKVTDLVLQGETQQTFTFGSGSARRSKFIGWRGGRKSRKERSLVERTALAISVAKRTASKVATAVLTSSATTSESMQQTMIEQPDIEFAKFTADSTQVLTTLVSRHNSKESSLLLAKLKVKRRNRKQGSTEQASSLPGEEESKISSSLSPDLKCLMDPLIPQNVWDRLTGREFPEHPELLEGLAKMGYKLASEDDSNEWIAWSRVGSSFKESIEDGAINVWTGQTRARVNDDLVSYYGSAAPFIKTRSIVPMSPIELIELMLDSSRVKTYNKWSVGRKDLWKSHDERTKIVQNTNNVPMQKKPLRSTTLLHACPVGGKAGPDASWLLLSRAIGPHVADDKDDVGTSDILLGVNLVQPIGNKSVLTAITHVYSSAVPGMLAERLGVKSSINFVHDLRALAVPASR